MSLRGYPKGVLEDRLAQYRFDLAFLRRHAETHDSVEERSLLSLIGSFEEELRLRDLVRALGDVEVAGDERPTVAKAGDEREAFARGEAAIRSRLEAVSKEKP